jgi:hypothetical protein
MSGDAKDQRAYDGRFNYAEDDALEQMLENC